MDLTLNVLRCPEAAVPESRRSSGGDLAIGRGLEAEWQLQDPERVLSKRHCALEYRGGFWQLRDLSTNGTFLNHAPEPIGRDLVAPLKDGDRLRLGSYEIEVRIALQAGPGQGSAGGWGAPLVADPAGHGRHAPDPFADPFAPQGAPPAAAPMAGFGGSALPDDFDPFGDDPPMPDHQPAASDAFMPPRVTQGTAALPDDWGLDFDIAPPAPPATAPLGESAPVDPFAEEGVPNLALPGIAEPAVAAVTTQPSRRDLAPPVPVAAPPPGAPAAADAVAILLRAAGLSPKALGEADPTAVLEAAGASLRAAIEGIRALLIARADVKREFRIEQTMLRAAGNNPLKFAASDEAALAALLTGKAGARAVAETARDLTAHQVATLAATQAAARALLHRLAPAGLEGAEKPGGFLGSREKRLWEAYKALHGQVADQFEDDFDSAFGKEFARAYEQASGKERPK